MKQNLVDLEKLFKKEPKKSGVAEFFKVFFIVVGILVVLSIAASVLYKKFGDKLFPACKSGCSCEDDDECDCCDCEEEEEEEAEAEEETAEEAAE